MYVYQLADLRPSPRNMTLMERLIWNGMAVEEMANISPTAASSLENGQVVRAAMGIPGCAAVHVCRMVRVVRLAECVGP